MSRLARGFPNNALMWRRGCTRLPVTYDATGAGAAASASSWSYNHALGVTANAVVCLMSAYTATASPTVTAKVGTTSMTLLGSVPNYYYDGTGHYCSVYLFGLLNPPTGTQTITATSSAASDTALNSVSYARVAGFGTAVTNQGASAAANVSVSGGPGAVGGFGGYTTNFTGYNQTSRFNVAHAANVNLSMVMGDSMTPGTVNFTATGGTAFGGIAVPLIPTPAPV